MHAARTSPALVAVIALALGACAAPPSPTPSTAAGARPLIVDLDMDSSDVMALAYVLNLDGYEVKAITVPGTGIANCPPGADHARAIAAAVGHPDIPVACGSSMLVGTGHAAPRGWRIPANDLYGVSLAASGPAAADDAVQLITRVLRDSTQPVDILTLGPLTDIADAFAADPSLRQRVGRVVAMAGAVDAPGNVDPDPQVGSPEWNVWFAPAAAAAVLGSGVPVVLVPLDATQDVPVTEGFFAQLRTDHLAAAADITFELLARNRFLTLGGQYFWDPLAATFLEEPGLLKLHQMPIRIDVDQGPSLGRTARASDGNPVQVATGADATRFARLFLAGLRRGPARSVPFAPGGPLAVSYDGAVCRVPGVSGLRAGPAWVRFDSTSTSEAAGVIVALRPGATWRQVEAYVADYAAQQAPPDFADLISIPQLAPGIESILNLGAGVAGVACLETDQGAVTRITLSDPFEIAS